MIKVEPVRAFTDNYIWVIQNPDNNACLIVDPGDAKPVIDYLEANNLQPEAILITHKHHDHVGGVKALQDRFDISAYGPASEAARWIDINVNANSTLHFDNTEVQFSVIELPGHTHGHIAYHTDGHLFCGDTLFVAGCGRVFEGTMAQMYQSLETLADLDDKTLIYCAHEYTLANLKFALTVEPDNPDLKAFYDEATRLRAKDIPTVPSSIAQEKRINPFMRCKEVKVTQAAQQHGMIAGGDSVAVFTTLRQWKDNF